jgi:transposase-like protein
MAKQSIVKIALAKIISLEIVCPEEYIGDITVTFGEFFSERSNYVRGICYLRNFDSCVRYTKRIDKNHFEQEFHLIISFPDNDESIRAYIRFISYLRETKKIPIECLSPNELFGE